MPTCLNVYPGQRTFLLIWKSVVGKLPGCQVSWFAWARMGSPIDCHGDTWSGLVFHELRGKLIQHLKHLLSFFFFHFAAYRAVFLSFSYSSHSQLLCIFYPFTNMISWRNQQPSWTAQLCAVVGSSQSQLKRALRLVKLLILQKLHLQPSCYQNCRVNKALYFCSFLLLLLLWLLSNCIPLL